MIWGIKHFHAVLLLILALCTPVHHCDDLEVKGKGTSDLRKVGPFIRFGSFADSFLEDIYWEHRGDCFKSIVFRTLQAR